MSSVKFKNLEVGNTYTALIWHSPSQKEPVEVKVLSVSERPSGVEIVTDKFTVRHERGAVFHAELNKRVTFRTADDRPEYVPAAPKERKPRGKTAEGFKAGSANAFAARPVMAFEEVEQPQSNDEEMSKRERFRKPDSGFCAPADRLAANNSEHVLRGPEGEEVWVWDKNNWRLPGQKWIREPRRMASDGYSYVGVAPEADNAE